MIIFSLLFQVVIGIVAVSCQHQYVQQQYLGPYAGAVDQLSQQSSSGSSSSASASSSSQSNNIGNYISGPVAYGPGPVGAVPVAGPVPSLPCAAVDPKVRTTYATESFHQNKGEILIHRPAPIIVKRPPTKVLVNHPPLVVKPAPVVLHKPPPVVLRKVFVKQHPRPVKVEPVYVNVVKPPAEKYYVKEKTAPIGYQVPLVQNIGSQASAQSAAQSAGAQQYRI